LGAGGREQPPLRGELAGGGGGVEERLAESACLTRDEELDALARFAPAAQW
jgi:hypothetical protein